MPSPNHLYPFKSRLTLLALALFKIPTRLSGQTTTPYAPAELSANDYARAEQFAIRNGDVPKASAAI